MAKLSFKSFSNLAISLDGKIADPDRPSVMLGSAIDRRMMQVIRAQADVVIFGATTLRAIKKPVKIKTSPKRAQIVNAVVSGSGDLPKDLPFWDDPKVIRFVFTTARGYARAVESCGGRAFVVLAGQTDLDAELIVRRLLDSGLKRLLVEGGGETMALFLAANLLQEMNVTLTPRILGGRLSPTLVGGKGILEPAVNLRLLKSKRAGNELFLQYQVAGAKKSMNL